MKYAKALTILCFSFTLMNCTDSNGGKMETSEKPKTTDTASNTPPPAVKSSNSNVLKFAMTTERFSSMGYLLKLSSWAEKVEAEKVTFLCVTEESLTLHNRQLIASMKLPANKDLLDRFMGIHILKGDVVFSKATDIQEVETIDGTKLKVDLAKHTIDGVPYTINEFGTDMGTVLEMTDVLRYPELELKERASKKFKEKRV